MSFTSDFKAGEYFIENVLKGKATENRVKNLVTQEAPTIHTQAT
jgi:lipoic acid synthetase